MKINISTVHFLHLLQCTDGFLSTNGCFVFFQSKSNTYSLACWLRTLSSLNCTHQSLWKKRLTHWGRETRNRLSRQSRRKTRQACVSIHDLYRRRCSEEEASLEGLLTGATCKFENKPSNSSISHRTKKRKNVYSKKSPRAIFV